MAVLVFVEIAAAQISSRLGFLLFKESVRFRVLGYSGPNPLIGRSRVSRGVPYGLNPQSRVSHDPVEDRGPPRPLILYLNENQLTNVQFNLNRRFL